MKFKALYVILFSFLFSIPLIAEEQRTQNKNTEFNVYTGMFDFSDDGKRSTLIVDLFPSSLKSNIHWNSTS